ncbi:ankyrin repeat domain-containing protein [Burkholderiaceae bacterium DAT-1]|nr:ankyrin repeat domain-containing protein [Burkholderiaceae bacterium DAT-1]
MTLSATSAPGEMDKQGRTDLHWHCFYGNTSAVRACLKNGYDPNAQDSSGYTPLMCLVEMHDNAAYRSRKRMFRYLIAAGANISLPDTIGATLKDHVRHDQRGRLRSFVRSEISRLLKRGKR